MKKKELKARIAELESDLNVAMARLSVAQMELAELRKSPAPYWPHDTITQPNPAPWTFPYVPQITCDALPPPQSSLHSLPMNTYSIESH